MEENYRRGFSDGWRTAIKDMIENHELHQHPYKAKKEENQKSGRKKHVFKTKPPCSSCGKQVKKPLQHWNFNHDPKKRAQMLLHLKHARELKA